MRSRGSNETIPAPTNPAPNRQAISVRCGRCQVSAKYTLLVPHTTYVSQMPAANVASRMRSAD